VAVLTWLTSGVVLEPGVPEDEPCTSRRPSSLREAPPRPRVGWALAVYGTVSRVMVRSLLKARFVAQCHGWHRATVNRAG
jgi:hypothetical protein